VSALGTAIASGLPPGYVQLQVGEAQCRRRVGLAAAQEGAHAGQQLDEGEWLDQIVIGAGLQPADPILDAVAGGEQQDGHIAVRAQAATDLQPV